MPTISPDAPIDLHSHTTASDGSDAPEALVQLASERGLAAIAVTDHDTVGGVAEALDAGATYGVEVIPGVEISAAPPDDVDDRDGVLHILGYLVDPENPALGEALGWMRDMRRERNPEIIKKLNALGVNVTLADAQRYAQGGQVGRPHIAQAVVAAGGAADVQDAFNRYLRTGGPAAVEKAKLPADRSIAVIRAAGGVAVMAHPYQAKLGDGEELEHLVEELVALGLGGIECWYSRHKPEQTARYRELADRFGLVATGGSDYHGTTKPNIALGLTPPVPHAVVDALRARCLV